MITNKIKIIIAEPYQLIYEGLSQILSNSHGQYDIFRASSWDEIRALLEQKSADIIIINPSLAANQPDIYNKIKANNRNVKWAGLVYSYFPPELLSTFSAILHVSSPPNEIIEIIKKLAALDQTDKVSQLTLSDREISVLKLMVAGNSNKEIAEKLFISTHTVISHRKNISAKTGIKSLSGLTIYAVLNNIISIENF